MNSSAPSTTAVHGNDTGVSVATYHKFAVLAALYIAQAIPASFFDTVLPVVLRQKGVALDQIGLLKWVAIPAAFKFLWAPAVDRYGWSRFGTYKTWIFPMQILTILCAIAMTQVDWAGDFTILMVIVAVWTMAAATQDIGVDGFAVRALTEKERPFGVSLQQFSGLIGTVIGGGAMIIWLGNLGFNNAVFIIVFVLTVPLFALLWYREPAAPPSSKTVSLKSIVSFFRRKGMMLWVAQIVLLIAGSALGSSMIAPMLVDQGFQLESFGVLYGVVFPIVGVVGAVLTPVFIRRFGRKKVLIGSAVLLCLDQFNLILIARFEPALPVVFAMLAWGVFTNIFLLISISTIFMDQCRPATAGTDWTIQMSILALAGAVFGGLGGFLAQSLGYTGLYLIALAMTSVGIMIVVRFLADGHLGQDTVPADSAS